MKIAVVGTAGGSTHEFASHMNRRLFESMVQTVATKVTPETILISGGAAWADHIAVTLFLRDKVAGLRLHLPCEWDESKTQLSDTGDSHWATNPGRTANAYHRKFTKVIGRSSLAEIVAAKNKGAILMAHRGFHARNKIIAQECDKTLNLTWAAGDAPTRGGSLDQWRKCTKPKEHISLRSLVQDRVHNGVDNGKRDKRKVHGNDGATPAKRIHMLQTKNGLPSTKKLRSKKTSGTLTSSTLDVFLTSL